jgi:hypothetical protein
VKGLTSPDIVEKNLRMAYDDAYYDGLRRRIRFTLGERYETAGSGLSTSLSGEIPDDVDILPNYYEPGQSRRILTNAFLMAAKVCYTEPDPDYPDAPRHKEPILKAFNKVLWKGRPHLGPTKYEEFGEWGAECRKAFLDADGLGTGFVQIGVRDGWTCIQHHPLTRVIWDRHRMDVSRARYIAFVHLLSEEEAVNMFGTKMRQYAVSDGSLNNSLRSVKCIQYFDMGLGSGKPTEMWRHKSFAGEVLDVSENEYGCIPAAHMDFVHFWGMRRNLGRIDFQIPDQWMRNAYERYMRLVLQRGPGFDAVDTGKMNADDQESFESGELLPAIRFEVPPLGKVGDYIQRFPAHEVPAALYQGIDYLDRNDPGQSGISDADRANVTSSPRTLGEIEEVQAGAASAQNWSQREYALFLARVFYKANYIAAKLHTAPTMVSYQGVQVPLNVPGDPRTNLAYYLADNTWPVVNEDALTRLSPVRKMQIAQGKWLPLMQDPYTNPMEVRRAMLTEYGEKDVERFLVDPMQVMQEQAMMAQATAGPQGPPQAA